VHSRVAIHVVENIASWRTIAASKIGKTRWKKSGRKPTLDASRREGRLIVSRGMMTNCNRESHARHGRYSDEERTIALVMARLLTHSNGHDISPAANRNGGSGSASGRAGFSCGPRRRADARVYAGTSTASTFHFRRSDGSFLLRTGRGLSREVSKQEAEREKEEKQAGKRTTMTTRTTRTTVVCDKEGREKTRGKKTA